MSGHLHAVYFFVSLCTDVSVYVCSSRAFPQKGITQSAWTDCTALPSFSSQHYIQHDYRRDTNTHFISIMIFNVNQDGYWRFNTVIEVHLRKKKRTVVVIRLLLIYGIFMGLFRRNYYKLLASRYYIITS